VVIVAGDAGEKAKKIADRAIGGVKITKPS
jgi:hypothetical protein